MYSVIFKCNKTKGVTLTKHKNQLRASTNKHKKGRKQHVWHTKKQNSKVWYQKVIIFGVWYSISLSAHSPKLTSKCFNTKVYLWRHLIKELVLLTTKTNETGRKLRFSAFQWYMGLGVADIVFINKNQLACSPLNINSSVLSHRLSSKKNWY